MLDLHGQLSTQLSSLMFNRHFGFNMIKADLLIESPGLFPWQPSCLSCWQLCIPVARSGNLIVIHSFCLSIMLYINIYTHLLISHSSTLSPHTLLTEFCHSLLMGFLPPTLALCRIYHQILQVARMILF